MLIQVSAQSCIDSLDHQKIQDALDAGRICMLLPASATKLDHAVLMPELRQHYLEVYLSQAGEIVIAA